MPKTVTIFTDGGNGVNHARWGFVVYEDGARTFAHAGSIGDPKDVTNNIVEYEGLLFALFWIATKAEIWNENSTLCTKPDSIQIKMDSKLVVKQVLGEYETKHPNLKALQALASDYIRQLQRLGINVDLVWIPREENIADRYIKGNGVPTCLIIETS